MAIERYGQLTRIEQRTVLALAAESRRLQADLQEVEQAIQAQIVGVAERQKLPPADYMVVEDQAGALWLEREMPAPKVKPPKVEAVKVEMEEA